MSHQPDEVAIFQVAREIPAVHARDKYLGQVCGRDQALRERVEALLLADQEDQTLLRSIAEPAAAGPVLSATPTVGDTIGRFKLLQQIGEGGMGTVYMAEQTKPVSRRVTLKLIKPGMDSKAVVARFEAERQALAMMDHPNIARVFDAGTTESGHPYFVMELVKGVPITEFCDEQKMSIAERLQLFMKVCEAVQHAHQKGIIHRDIKPTNVLVAKYDDKPVPKIIDFGVAKAIGQRLTEKTMFTQYGQIVGTLEYMSPEQAQFNQLDVDTRSDIYALGVLLYELLTGETPFDAQRLRSSAFEEVLRILQHEEPPRPSNRVHTSVSAHAISVARRAAGASHLGSLLRGDLDWLRIRGRSKGLKNVTLDLTCNVDRYRAMNAKRPAARIDICDVVLAGLEQQRTTNLPILAVADVDRGSELDVDGAPISSGESSVIDAPICSVSRDVKAEKACQI